MTKTLVFGRYALITPETAGYGIAIGGVMILGAYLARQILERISDRAFVRIVEGLLACLGLAFLVYPPR